MRQELLGRVHRELLDVLNSTNQDKIHHDGDDFHELLNDVEKALAQPERHELQAKGEHPAPCARHCEANAFQIVIKNLKAQLAQPEQEPVAWQFFQDGKWYNGMDVHNHRANTEAAGVPVRDLYTHPPQRKPLTFAGQSISEIRLANGLTARFVKDILIVEFD